MNKIKKIVFWIAVVILGLWILMPILREILGLEFANDSVKYNYKELLFYIVPVAILLTLFGTIKSNYNKVKIIGRIIATFIVAVGIIIVMFISIFGDMCAWTDREVLYENKNDSNVKIIVRDFGCGATDSGPPAVRVHKLQYFTKYFIRSTKIDTTKIDKDKWIKVE